MDSDWRIWKVGKLDVYVRVIQVRSVYGRTDYLITPVAGSGEQWVRGSLYPWEVSNENGTVVASDDPNTNPAEL